MLDNKEKNFVSAVVYLHNDADAVVPFFQRLYAQLETRFAQYELIAVDDCCTDDTVQRLRTWAAVLQKPLTIIRMSLHQGVETAMNAGLDCAIGDYVYEFDCVQTQFPDGLIGDAYALAMQGNDIVSVCPTQQRRSSKLFYRVFNRFSRSAYQLRTEAFRLVSRRAINRVHAVSARLPYRKAAYAASGLKIAELLYAGCVSKRGEGRTDLAIDSLVLYTDAGYAASLGLSGLMLLLTLLELLYTLVIYFAGRPIAGWTTTMLVLTVGFLGVFALFTLALKYLSLILEFTFKKQPNLIESIEKIQK
jgi:dolichol-phosphate mannosyltransferase